MIGADRPPGLATLRSGLGVTRPFILIGLAVGACYVIGLMLWPFLPAIVTSAVLAVLVRPAFQRFARRFRRRDVAAFIATIVVFFLGLLPAVGVSMLLVEELRTGITWIGTDGVGLLSPAGPLARWIAAISRSLGLEGADLTGVLSGQAQGIATVIAARTVGLFTGLGGWLLQGAIALFTLYYLLRDGDALIRYVKWLLPLEPAASDRLFGEASEVMHATVFGSLVVALVQGALGGIAFWALGLHAPVVWATIMGVLSILPAVGAWCVWVPAAVFLLLSGEVLRGLILAAAGTLIISTIDNVLRAILVSDRAHLHPLVVFFSVLGGLVVFGATGIIIGPVLFSLALALVRIARTAIDGPAQEPAPGYP